MSTSKSDPLSELEAARYELRFAEQKLASLRADFENSEQRVSDARRKLESLESLERPQQTVIKKSLFDVVPGDVLVNSFRHVIAIRVDADLIYVKGSHLPISKSTGNHYRGPGCYVDHNPYAVATAAQRTQALEREEQIAEGDSPSGIPRIYGPFSNLGPGVSFMLHGVIRCAVTENSRGFNSPWVCHFKMMKTNFNVVCTAEDWSVASKNGFVKL